MRLMVDLIHLYIKNITKNKTITLFPVVMEMEMEMVMVGNGL